MVKQVVIFTVGKSQLHLLPSILTDIPLEFGFTIIVMIFDDNSSSSMTEFQKNLVSMNVTYLPIENKITIESSTIYLFEADRALSLEGNNFYLGDTTLDQSVILNTFLQSLVSLTDVNLAMVLFFQPENFDIQTQLESFRSPDGLIIIPSHTQLADALLPLDSYQHNIIVTKKIADTLIDWQEGNLIDCQLISNDLNSIFGLLFAQTNHDFSSYKLSTIYRRICRQMRYNNLRTLEEYLGFLREHNAHVEVLFNDLLIGVTHFFRDKDAFFALKKSISKRLIENQNSNESFRVWIPGCSTGEEAYSIGMIILECVEELRLHTYIQIFATDIDVNSLEIARKGIYSKAIEEHINPHRLKTFFVPEKNHYKVKRELREIITFGAQNIISDPPFTKLDLLSCRNLLIYLNSQMQKNVLPKFHFSLKPDGILFLGHSESIAGFVNLFSLSTKNWKIYRRKETDTPHNIFIKFPNLNSFGHPPFYKQLPKKLVAHINSKDGLYQELLNELVPATLIINTKGNILYQHGNTDSYLSISTKKESENFFKLVPKSLKIQAVVKNCILEQHEQLLERVELKNKGSEIAVDLRIYPLNQTHLSENLIAIQFECAVTPEKALKIGKKFNTPEKLLKKIIDLEHELQSSKEHLQTTIEELQSSNEELHSTNEELQSTNEEIESTKEELLSLNEELIIVNAELQVRLDQFSTASADMDNLFHSTQLIAIFLDHNLNIKRFTPRIQKLINLIPNDIGRSIKHFTTNLDYPNLVKDVKHVVETQKDLSLEVSTTDGEWYQTNIIPYRTLMNDIDGVVITFTDISLHKQDLIRIKDANYQLLLLFFMPRLL